MAGPVLTVAQRTMLAGGDGPAASTALRLVVELARVSGADALVPITSAHIDSCLYHGQAGVDFAALLVDQGAQVRVPTTLNVSSLDLIHPRLVKGDREMMQGARRLMDLYTSMGCRPTWTCAPYQVDSRPALGEHVGWAESNAIVFVNSVLGARTDRYGDFTDICAAVSGFVPLSGLHLDRNRLARVVFDVGALPRSMLDSDVLPAVLGYVIGKECGTAVPAIVGLPRVGEDGLKALGAAAASSGGVALFHAVGITPEAPTLAAVTDPDRPPPVIRLSEGDLTAARAELTTSHADRVEAISIGTPHCSLTELTELANLLDGAQIPPTVTFYACTGRSVLQQAERTGVAARCQRAGVQFVTDTCTYVTPILRAHHRTVMTNSAKWAHYAPGNMAVDVVLSTLSECVRTACAGGRVQRDPVWVVR